MRFLRWVVGAALFVALLFLSLQNAEPAKLKFYGLWSFEAPLIFVVLIAFAIGVAAGLLAGAVRNARLRRELAQLRRAERVRETPPRERGAG